MKTSFFYLSGRIYTLLLLMVLQSSMLLSSANSYFFYVQLKDKNNSAYSISYPSQYLSAKALARRASFGISCDSTDLPVNESYIQQITNLGIKVHSRSKWMNGVTVWVNDSVIMQQVRLLSCVKSVQYTGLQSNPVTIKSKIKKEIDSFDYGSATAQINQVNGSYLHNSGFTGKNILIGILDAGFYNAGFSNPSKNPGFDSLHLQSRLIGTKDIIDPNSDIFAQDAHGANVLSIIAGNLPGQYLGAAPHASFWLIRTEYVPSEYLVETDFWVSGIEFADSVGVDVVNSSLGYTQFDDPAMNYTYSNMNGTFSRASRAANLASKKGIIVCNSAGNDGNKSWHYIGVPGDADGILTVGAVTSTGVAAAFSSFGPSADLRIKPEISATGAGTAYIYNNGVTTTGNGTSYSSPIMAGLMACFLQYTKANYPGKSVAAMLESVIKSGSTYSNPTDQLGYGIPNFQQATASFATNRILRSNSTLLSQTIFNALNKTIKVVINNPTNNESSLVRIYSVTGKLVDSILFNSKNIEIESSSLSKGIYAVNVSGKEFSETHKLIVY